MLVHWTLKSYNSTSTTAIQNVQINSNVFGKGHKKYYAYTKQVSPILVLGTRTIHSETPRNRTWVTLNPLLSSLFLSMFEETSLRAMLLHQG